MTVFRKSVPKPQGGSGTAKPRNGKLTVIYTDDVISEPTRDSNGVKMVGNYVLAPGAKMETLYATPSTQKFTQEIEGEEDMEGFIKKLEAIHPADDLAINEFVQNNIGVPVIIIFGEGCGSAAGRVLGSVCNPMKLKGSAANDNEGRKNTLMYEQSVKDVHVAGFYYGEITLSSNFEAATVDLDLTIANGAVQQLPVLAATDTISVLSTDLENGTIVSLIGGGGADPAVLDPGVQGVVNVILLNDTQWVALDKAVINLEVIAGGATTYLLERSRS
ncbi:hypothetical protein ACFFU1_16675 [Algibacter miyuki]|uniref:Virion structural protein n=1 Tax=Algibacter miyuki TaxID=1306933 RepID=A0ABV5H3Q6_9FLAO|nr:hypothetical protein [Algibacter miyuki]MDN3665614.1 hypothetical protein [Algibacter miyuki]